MKRLFSVFIFSAVGLITLLFLPACPILEKLGETNTGFWARRADNNQWYQVPSTLAYEGTYCQVYVEDANSYLVSSATAQNIANEFDNNIYNLMRTKFGTEPDEDENGKVVILVLDIIDGMSGSSYVAGYFDSTHQLDDPYSNKKDMLFMDCNPGISYMSAFYLTIAHEFQHMINFNQKYLVQGGSPQDTWINEGLSAAAETLYTGVYTNWKTDYYNSDSGGEQNIRLGQNFVSWGRGVPSVYTDLLGNYATVYLFFQWLTLQTNGSNMIYKEIIDTNFSDYRCVEAVANNRLYAGTWKEYLRDWFTANLYSRPTGKFGYRGKITLTPYGIAPNGAWLLLPGEGVYSPITLSWTISTQVYIDYAGLNTSTYATDYLGTTYDGNVLLSYNFNGNPSGSPTNTGNLPGASIAPNRSGFDYYNPVPSIQFPKNIPVPIDTIFGPGDGPGRTDTPVEKKFR